MEDTGRYSLRGAIPAPLTSEASDSGVHGMSGRTGEDEPSWAGEVRPLRRRRARQPAREPPAPTMPCRTASASKAAAHGRDESTAGLPHTPRTSRLRPLCPGGRARSWQATLSLGCRNPCDRREAHASRSRFGRPGMPPTVPGSSAAAIPRSRERGRRRLYRAHAHLPGARPGGGSRGSPLGRIQSSRRATSVASPQGSTQRRLPA